MNGFKSILAVYSDAPGSDDVLVQAVSLARASGAKLTVVHPHENPRSGEAINEARRRLPRLIPWIAQEGVTDVATDVLIGVPHVEIIRRVLAEGHDLVITGSDSGRALKDVFIGSTARNLMLKCPCAVWVLKPGQAVPCANVMAALDPLAPEPCGADLDVKILDLATSVALAHDACLHAVHFWDVDGEDAEMLKTEIPRDTKRQILDKHRSIRRKALNALLARYPRSQFAHQIHLPRGRPQRELLEMATDLSVDVIVMGTECRTGLSRLLMGNFVETVLGCVRCSVVAVKPEGFCTPIPEAQHDCAPNPAYAGVQ